MSVKSDFLGVNRNDALLRSVSGRDTAGRLYSQIPEYSANQIESTFINFTSPPSRAAHDAITPDEQTERPTEASTSSSAAAARLESTADEQATETFNSTISTPTSTSTVQGPAEDERASVPASDNHHTGDRVHEEQPASPSRKTDNEPAGEVVNDISNTGDGVSSADNLAHNGNIAHEGVEQVESADVLSDVSVTTPPTDAASVAPSPSAASVTPPPTDAASAAQSAAGNLER